MTNKAVEKMFLLAPSMRVSRITDIGDGAGSGRVALAMDIPGTSMNLAIHATVPNVGEFAVGEIVKIEVAPAPQVTSGEATGKDATVDKKTIWAMQFTEREFLYLGDMVSRDLDRTMKGTTVHKGLRDLLVKFADHAQDDLERVLGKDAVASIKKALLG